MKNKVHSNTDTEEFGSLPNENMDLVKESKISAIIEDTYNSQETYEGAYQRSSTDRNYFDY